MRPADRGRPWRRLAALVVGVTMAGGLSGGPATSQPAASLLTEASRLGAERSGVPPERLAAVNVVPVHAPARGRREVLVKLLDRESGMVSGVTLEHPPPPRPGEQGRAEGTSQPAAEDPLAAALAARLARAWPDTPIDVIIWLKAPFAAPPARAATTADQPALAEADQLRALDSAATGRRAAAVARLTTPVLARLQQVGAGASAARYVPALYARLPAPLIRLVAAWPEVERVYLARPSQPELDVAGPTLHADAVHARGIGGAGVQVAQLEAGGGRIAAANPYLRDTIQDAQFVCPTESAHSTAVAGILRSTHLVLYGVAPRSALWAGGSCRGDPAELHDRAAAAVEWGAQVLNLSYGTETNRVPDAEDRYFDDLVFHLRRTVVKSAGNLGLTSGDVTSPGLGYNVLTVGNFDDGRTVDWADDAMNPTSGYRAPISAHGDRQKPEVAAPGTNIRSTTLGPPWVGDSNTGTSFATAMASGTAALLLERRRDLSQWPEAVKAILLATAVHNIEGDARLSARAGAGGIVADRADAVVQGLSGGWGAQPYDCTTASALNLVSFALDAGQRARAAIAWTRDPSWPGWPSEPSADLDLVVLGPSGSPVAVSASADNPFELVDFTASSPGRHTLRVSRGRCDRSPGGLGWAWHLGAGPAAPAPAAAPLCTPTRPPVSVATAPSGPGQLQVTVRAQTLPGSPSNTLQVLRFGEPRPAINALIDIAGEPGRADAFAVSLPPGTTSTSFAVRRAVAGEPTTVALIVVDGCGDWPAVVGGGASAF